ncbi:SCO0930 family lipoprotein [Streptomyces sp. TRM64462]|uniref:SCO0930 family lipoprotein n=1 Tax=Streptomyces sp. TRM64462 TaxID=2741726 RepID=UPI001585F840|nr:SCO0930 family lipoprotein [Streptomyces sp. TRM64462]
MNTRRNAALAAAAVAAALTLTACGQDQGDSLGGQSVGAAAPAGAPGRNGAGYGDGYGAGYGKDAGAAGAEISEAGQLAARDTAQLGKVLTDSEGRTLYRFDKDSANPPKSACEGDCAKAWPVVTAEGAKPPSGVDASKLGVLTRPDGTKQLTVDGWPMYRYAKDTAPGDLKGQGVGGTWYAAAPDGKKAAPGSAGGGGEGVGGGEGDGDEQGAEPADRPGLSVRKDPKLGDIIVDRDGRTVYRFTKDSAWPMKTACTGECLDKWPVVAPVDKNDTEGIELKGSGPNRGYVTFKRPDGKEQQTIDCWPLYTFAGDKKPGDTNGQGVGGSWYAVSPDGELVGAPE